MPFKPHCIYCDVILSNKLQKVCSGCKLHHRKVLHQKRQGRDYTPHSCVDCGCEIVGKIYSAKRCDDCWRKNHVVQISTAKQKKLGPRPQLDCPNCGGSVPEDRHRTAVYCSLKCREQYRSKSGKKSAYLKRTRKARSDYLRKWRNENPAKRRNQKTRRRLSESCGQISDEDWSRLLNRHQHRCFYCKRDGEITMDHVVPLSRGGTNTIGNVVPACRSCNSSKCNRLLVEWLPSRSFDAV